MAHSIGIFGGSFNPIHCGHIALAKEILRRAAPDEIWMMVSPLNPLKRQDGLLADEERLRLARKALQGEERIKACDFEFGLPRPSYTWNTLEALRQAYPDHSFSLIIGGDNWTQFDRWYRADDIRRRYPLIVYPRRGDSDGGTWSDTPLFDISSTEVRRRVKAGEPIAGLVPDVIVNDVQQLYT